MTPPFKAAFGIARHGHHRNVRSVASQRASTREARWSLQAKKRVRCLRTPFFAESEKSLLPGLEPVIHFCPVHHVPPLLQVVGAAILIFQVVSMLPNVVAQDRVKAL